MCPTQGRPGIELIKALVYFFDRYVLTVAHCVDERAAIHLESLYKSKTLSVSIGSDTYIKQAANIRARLVQNGRRRPRTQSSLLEMKRSQRQAGHNQPSRRQRRQGNSTEVKKSASRDTIDVELTSVIFPTNYSTTNDSESVEEIGVSRHDRR